MCSGGAVRYLQHVMFELLNMRCNLGVCALPNNAAIGVDEDDVVGEGEISRYMLSVGMLQWMEGLT